MAPPSGPAATDGVRQSRESTYAGLLRPTFAGFSDTGLHRIDKLPVMAGARQHVHLQHGSDAQRAPESRGGTLDRGSGINKQKREQLAEASLVDTGKCVTARVGWARGQQGGLVG